MIAQRSAFAAVEATCDRGGRIEWVCAELVAGRPVLGKRLSVGTYTPAVLAEHAWAVIGKRGEPVALAHDAFEAAAFFVDAEERGPSEMEDECVSMATDAEWSRVALADRLDEYEWRLAGYNAFLAASRSARSVRGAA